MKNKLNIQLWIAAFLVLLGATLLMMGFWVIPLGEISPSVLTAFGEICTFSAGLLGIDYHYKTKIIIDKKNDVSTYDSREVKEEDKTEIVER